MRVNTFTLNLNKLKGKVGEDPFTVMSEDNGSKIEDLTQWMGKMAAGNTEYLKKEEKLKEDDRKTLKN